MLFQRRQLQPGHPQLEERADGPEAGSGGERRRIHSARPLNADIQVGWLWGLGGCSLLRPAKHRCLQLCPPPPILWTVGL
jgi:hypothetical protein